MKKGHRQLGCAGDCWSSYKGFRDPKEIISNSVWLYYALRVEPA